MDSQLQTNKKQKSSFQKQKLYIEELQIDSDINAFEKELKSFLTRYGSIIDIKILQNSILKRKQSPLRLCHL